MSNTESFLPFVGAGIYPFIIMGLCCLSFLVFCDEFAFVLCLVSNLVDVSGLSIIGCPIGFL